MEHDDLPRESSRLLFSYYLVYFIHVRSPCIFSENSAIRIEWVEDDAEKEHSWYALSWRVFIRSYAADRFCSVHKGAASCSRGLSRSRLHGEDLHLVLREAEEREGAGSSAGGAGYSVRVFPAAGEHGVRRAEAWSEAASVRQHIRETD